MPAFGEISKRKLAECHSDLQLLFNEVIKYFDCFILCGFRDQAEQDRLFNEGKSKLRWPHGKHNSIPSKAIDVAPYNALNDPVDWKDASRFYFFGGYVMGIAKEMGIKIRYGGDFNMNTRTKDEKFVDLPHFELVE